MLSASFLPVSPFHRITVSPSSRRTFLTSQLLNFCPLPSALCPLPYAPCSSMTRMLFHLPWENRQKVSAASWARKMTVQPQA